MEQLKELLSYGVTPSHTIQYMKETLLNKGFQELSLDSDWDLKENGMYYVNLYGTNGLAFCVGNHLNKKVSFRIGMAHSDYPCLQLKPEFDIQVQNGKTRVTKWNVEIYGGMYQKSWLDRPLGVAGKIILRSENPFEPRVLLYRSDRALAVIPSLAIHWDRELNKKGALDVGKELVPIAGLSEDTNLLQEIAENLDIQTEDILDYDLYLYNMQQPEIVGLDRSMVSAPRLDNLTSVGALLSAFSSFPNSEGQGSPENTIDVMVVFDHEEVGSLSKQGADSELLSMVLNRIGKGLIKDFCLENVMKNGFLLSVDVAHAHHPNYEEKSDMTNKAYLGSGFSIKKSVGQKYGTTAETAGVIKQLCEKEQIPYTIAINKTGIPGGSTLGPIASSHLPFPCADIGMPILAMHAATELGAVTDYDALKQVLNTFYTYGTENQDKI